MGSRYVRDCGFSSAPCCLIRWIFIDPLSAGLCGWALLNAGQTSADPHVVGQSAWDLPDGGGLRRAISTRQAYLNLNVSLLPPPALLPTLLGAASIHPRLLCVFQAQ